MSDGNGCMSRLITFEGGDGCGKSTQLRLTADWLRAQGYMVLETRQPGGSALGQEIRNLLLSHAFEPVPACELLLFLADRVQHVQTVIKPALAQGDWVLCDRYSDSTWAYQWAARALSNNVELAPMLAFAEQGVRPSRTFWLDLPVEQALARMAQRSQTGEASNRLDDESMLFHQRVYAAFQDVYQREPERVIRIDACADIDKVQQDIRQQWR